MNHQWASYDAVLFDLDGVLTPTALLHRQAWQKLFDAVLADVPGAAPYTEQDYFDYVDGRQRADGVRSVLHARGIDLPEGARTDPPNAHTVNGLGNRKDQAFNELLATQGVQPYPGTVKVLESLAVRGLALAVVSSSRNARAVLASAGLLGHFRLIVDGNVAVAERLAGKPAPDTYCYAAKQLGVLVARAVVVEDATSGVAAGRAGGFGLVVGVNRGAGDDALRAAGADVVISALEELEP